MKRKLLFTLTVLLCIACLFSCKLFGGLTPDDNGGAGDTPDDGDAFLAKGTEVTVITDGTVNADDFSYAIFDLTGVPVRFAPESSEPIPHELIIGNTSRELSKKAYRRIENEVLSDDTAMYVIYSDGTSLAFAYNCQEAFDKGYEKLLSDILSSENLKNGRLEFKNGKVAEESFSLDELYSKIGDAESQEAWNKLEVYLKANYNDADNALRALRQIYALYTPELYGWLADLYDPAAGGFYYSNSARNTVGYGVDIESTRQALNILSQNGIISSYSQLPEKMRNEIITFVQGCQSADDGYFYHPQWAGMETTVERRSRDLNWAVAILRDLGARPLYSTVLSGGTSPTSFLKSPLRIDTVSAASKVLPVDSNLPSHLQSEAAFLAYLKSFDWAASSYAPGNTIASQASQILAAGLIDVAVDFFDELMDPNTGMWDSDFGSNDAINGYLKVSAVYVVGKVPLPYAEIAADGCIANILSDEFQTTVCHTYNPWAALANIRETLSKHGNTSHKAELERITDKLYANLPEYISKSTDKIKEFRKTDGSFSYTHDMTSSNSQGMPVAVWGTNEGDVNATVLAMSLSGYMFQALGIDAYRPNVYTSYDRYKFIERIDNLNPVIKSELTAGPAIDFEEGDIAELLFVDSGLPWWNTDFALPEEVEEKKAYAYITEDGDNMALEFGKADMGHESRLEFRHFGNKGNSRYVVEMKFKFKSGELGEGTGWLGRFALYNGGRFYTVTFQKLSDGNLSLGGVATLEADKWHTVRLEYYSNSRKNICMIYLDGEYKGDAGASNLEYNDSAFSKFFVELRNQAKNVRLQIDDVLISSDTEPHASESESVIPETRPDLPEKDRAPGLGDYYNSAKSDGIKTDYNGEGDKAPTPDNILNVEVELTEEKYVLFYKSDVNGEAYLRFNYPTCDPAIVTPAGILEFDFKLGNNSTAVPSRIGLWCNGLEVVLNIAEKDGKLYFSDKSGKPFAGSPLFDKDRWVNLRFEYFFPASSSGKAVLGVYIDNEYKGEMLSTVTNNRIDSATGRPSTDRVNIYLHQADESAYMCLDNLYFGFIDKAFSGNIDDIGGSGNKPEDPVDPPVVTPPDEDEDKPVDTSLGYYPSTAPGDRFGYTDDSATPSFEWLGPNGIADADLRIEDGSLVFDKTTANEEEYIYWNTAKTSYGAMVDPIFIFEAKLKFEEISSASPGKIYIRAAGYKYTIALTKDADGNVRIGGANGFSFESGKTYMVRFECDAKPTLGTVEIKMIVSENFSEFTEALTLSLSAANDQHTGKAHLYLGKDEMGMVTISDVYVGYTDSGILDSEESGEDDVTEPSTSINGESKKGKGSYYGSFLADINLGILDFASGSAPSVQIFPQGRKPAMISEIKDAILKLYKISTSAEEYVRFNFYPPQELEQYSSAVWEADVAFGNLSVGTVGRMTVAIGGFETVLGIHADADGKIRFGNEKTPSDIAILDVDTWYNLRFEFTCDETVKAGSSAKAKLYVDNEYAGELTGLTVNNRDWTNVRNLIYLAKDQESAYFFLDNYYFGFNRSK